MEKLRGVDFTKIEQAPSLNIVGTSFNGYWSSDNKFLEAVLKNFEIKPTDSIIDIGCGKGQVLLKFEKYGFGNVAGIELTKKLFVIATKNMEKLKKGNILIFNTNAVEFQDYGRYNYFYFYNPFMEDIMKLVMAKIENSLLEYPRKIVVIYKNPVCHKVIIEGNVFKKVNEYETELKDIQFYTYSNFL